MDFVKEVKTAIELVKLNSKVIPAINQNKDGLLVAIIIVAIAGIASGIGSLNVIGAVFGAVFNIIGLFIGAAILYVIALIFGGRASFMDLLRPLGYAMILMWITVIPVIGPMLALILWIWAIVIDIVIVKTVYNFSTGKAAAVVLIPVIVIGVIVVIVVVIAGLALFGALMAGGANIPFS